jgi:hypothetical protein
MKSRWLEDTTPMEFDVSTTAEVWFAGSGSQDGLSGETRLLIRCNAMGFATAQPSYGLDFWVPLAYSTPVPQQLITAAETPLFQRQARDVWDE